MVQFRNSLREKLYQQDGHRCHYCKIHEADFSRLWGKFYGLTTRGRRLEIDRKDAVVIQGASIVPVDQEYAVENCVLACALCNMAKSNMFTYQEFIRVGKEIEKIWRQRKQQGLSVRVG